MIIYLENYERNNTDIHDYKYFDENFISEMNYWKIKLPKDYEKRRLLWKYKVFFSEEP